MFYLHFRLAGAVLLAVLAWAIFATPRYVILHSMPAVGHLTAVKIPPELGDMVGALDEAGVHVPREHSKVEIVARLIGAFQGKEPKPASFDNMTEPMLGYSVREYAFLGMPFGYQTEDGHVLYVRNDWGTIYGQLTPPAMELLNKANGRDLTTGNLFPFWLHTWGWLWVLWGIFTYWLWQRGNARRREALGLID